MANAGEADGYRVPKVLVGIDGSADSERAFRAGLRIARHRDLPLHLVGTFPKLIVTDAYYVPMMTEYLDTALRDTHMLDRYADQAHGSGVAVTTRAVEGNPGRILIDETRTAQVAVVGKRGRNRFAGRFLGSVSSQLAAHGHCPTLVVPRKWESKSTNELLVQAQELPHDDAAATEPLSQMEESAPRDHERRDFANVRRDFNFDSEVVAGVDISDKAGAVVHMAAEAASMIGRPLTLLSAAPLNAAGRWTVNTVEHNQDISNLRRPYVDNLRESAGQVSKNFPELTVRWQFFDGSAAGLLAEASRTAALIAVGTRGHGGFAGLMLGSVSQSVLNRAVCPVFVVPTHKR